MVAQGVAEVVVGKLVDDEEALAFGLCLLLFVGEFALLYFDVVLLGQVAQRFGVGQLFVLHDEVHRVASLSAGKTLAQTLGWRDVEGGSLVIVEGTETHVVHAPLAQGDEVGHDVVNLRRVQYSVYGYLVYHVAVSGVGSGL